MVKQRRWGGERGAAMRQAGLEAEPSRERRRQGAVVRAVAVVEDEAGGMRRAVVWRGLDTLATMSQRGTITATMAAAGERFHDAFRRAGLDDLAAPDPRRVAGHGLWRQAGGNERARLEVAGALVALGGFVSPGGSCAWHVLGCEWSLRQWATSVNWVAGGISHHYAAGILIAGLGVLDAHFRHRAPVLARGRL